MNKEKIIIGLVGEIASGKGTSAHYLEQKYQAAYYRFSTVLRKILKLLHLKINRRNMASLSLTLRKSFGEDVLDRTLSEEIKNDSSRIIVVDGIRRKEDMQYLSQLDKFYLVYLETDLKTAYYRLVKRHENTDDEIKSWEQFQKDHQLETEVGIKKLKEKADFIIDNNGSLEELYNHWDSLIVQLKK